MKGITSRLCLEVLAAFALAGCATPSVEAPAATQPAAPAPSAPVWVADVLGVPLGKDGAAAARGRLFRSGEAAEVFAGLVAFAHAQDPELRRIAAFHLSGAAPFASQCGVSIGDALEDLRRDADSEVRRLAGLMEDLFYEGAEPTEIVSGEARAGEERPIPYPGLPGVRIHLLVSKVDWDNGPWAASINYWAEARTEGGGVMGGAGSHHVPDMTGSRYIGMLTDDAQYGFDLWFRVVDGGTVHWWLRGLRKPLS